MKVLTFAVGFAAGYVLGSRAGRERYEQIAGKVGEFLDKPAVTRVQEKAKALVDQGTQAVTDKLDTAADNAATAAKTSRPAKAPARPSPATATGSAI